MCSLHKSSKITCLPIPPSAAATSPEREVEPPLASPSFTGFWGRINRNYWPVSLCLIAVLSVLQHIQHTYSAAEMSARTFSLPIRAFSRTQFAQQAERYTCRRCLHTTQPKAEALTPETTTTTTDAQAPPPSDLPAQKEYNAGLPASQRDYSLTKTDRLVKRILPHDIRPQLLQHVDPSKLHGREREAAEKLRKHHDIVGVVVRTGMMEKTVSVRVAGRRWEPRVKKVCFRSLSLPFTSHDFLPARKYMQKHTQANPFPSSTSQTTRTT